MVRSAVRETPPKGKHFGGKLFLGVRVSFRAITWSAWVGFKHGLFKHGFNTCPHNLRGIISRLLTWLNMANIASRKTDVSLALAMYS